ncbi:enoyl-CoA hydratase/isomerase family protein [Sphingomonas arantia]|uniref:3-hydroxyisobutyryl-CoA hydrolase n=1 Tax=Sphingomonas arantia TaxID=1460676 RepID=A0ABW4TT63_9SPHN
MTMTHTIIAATEGRIARLRLNRPKPIHALDQAMCTAMIAALTDWREHPEIEAVLIDHADGRGFCAGGDVRGIASSAAGDGQAARDFFRTEYQLNHLLFTYAKPTVAFMDGIVMGGGVGIALPTRYRIATERTVLAMPETTIGLFPDVGGGWYLSRLPGRIGHYLALTGARIDGAEACTLGLATHYIPSEALDGVKAAIGADPQAIETILDAAAVTPPPAAILDRQPEIDRLFASDDYEEVLTALEADPGEWAAAQRALLATKSPLSCKVSLRLLADGAGMQSFADEMRMEYAVAVHICQRPDFAEGVRALLIDKDNAPIWDPATPEAVTDHMLDTIFAPLPAAEEWEPVRL